PSYIIRLFLSHTDTSTIEIYTLSLHDALPISALGGTDGGGDAMGGGVGVAHRAAIRGSHRGDGPGLGDRDVQADGAEGAGDAARDRKSTRLNSSHQIISYAVFCLKKKN